jgi:hypothetical protein
MAVPAPLAEVFATLGVRMPPLFADDNSSYRRALRRADTDARAREQRRTEILETLRRLRDNSNDPTAVAAAERLRRHKELLERYPPLF